MSTLPDTVPDTPTGTPADRYARLEDVLLDLSTAWAMSYARGTEPSPAARRLQAHTRMVIDILDTGSVTGRDVLLAERMREQACVAAVTHLTSHVTYTSLLLGVLFDAPSLLGRRYKRLASQLDAAHVIARVIARTVPAPVSPTLVDRLAQVLPTFADTLGPSLTVFLADEARLSEGELVTIATLVTDGLPYEQARVSGPLL